MYINLGTKVEAPPLSSSTVIVLDPSDKVFSKWTPVSSSEAILESSSSKAKKKKKKTNKEINSEK